MEDRTELALEQYDFQIKSRRRARGAVLLETNEGLRLMREYTKITPHFEFENEINPKDERIVVEVSSDSMENQGIAAYYANIN